MMPIAEATVLRAVETQYVASTLRLVDSAQAQSVLEEALEASKPPVPDDFRQLDYLLYTPFRYPPSPWPSRFRGATDPGVFYGAGQARTALAEVSHWRLRFLLDAVDLAVVGPTAHTLFSVRIRAATADVAQLEPSLRSAILDPENYAAAQDWAQRQRVLGAEAIRYPSVRDKPGGVCWAVLSPRAFRSRPRLIENWTIRVTRDGAQCRRAGKPLSGLVFDAATLLARNAGEAP